MRSTVEMLLTIGEFRNLARGDMDHLVSKLRVHTGRGGAEEAASWRNSLSRLADMLSDPPLQGLHLYLRDTEEQAGLTLEYRLPQSSNHCDVVLMGNNPQGEPSVVIMEMKHWDTAGDKPGAAEGMMYRQGSRYSHPSDQVEGYVNYCRHFHSAIHRHKAKVAGCVVFTKDPSHRSYQMAPNDRLAREYPLFATVDDTEKSRLGQFLCNSLAKPNAEFAKAFTQGVYEQERGFTVQIAKAIQGSKAFELLDSQRLALRVATDAINRAFRDDEGNRLKKPRKTVLVIEGPPGSGKSVIAAQLWAEISGREDLAKGNLAIVSTSAAQNNNWEGLFRSSLGKKAAAFIKKANDYNLSTTGQLGKIRKKAPKAFEHIADWRDNIEELRGHEGHVDKCPDNTYLVSICDEAHALVNPEFDDGRGQFGFPVQFGPQAYHIMRGSLVSIFLMDSKQSFRQQETTSRAQIEQWGKELGAQVIDAVSLKDSQYRCRGSKEYLEWVEAVLAGRPAAECVALADKWKQVGLRVELVDSPALLEADLRRRSEAGGSARLVSSYTRKWKTKGKADPHRLPAFQQDFNFRLEDGGRDTTWARPWNTAEEPYGYETFIRRPEGTRMHEDQLSEIGCPYVVRGFDFDHVGLLWLGDLLWRGKWELDLSEVHETALSRLVGRAKKNPSAKSELLNKICQAYRILLTRGMSSYTIWCPDAATRKRLEECIG